MATTSRDAGAGAGMRLPHILIVEDDREIADLLAEMAQENGLAASIARSGLEMDRILAAQQIDLLVLDAMLPGEDGFSICRRIRAANVLPILMLTARNEDINRVLGLELGADDYVTKPFNSRELMARIKALLRRASYGAPPEDGAVALRFEGWRLEPRARRLLDPDGAEISLTSAEFDVLLAFCANPGQVLTRGQLLSLTGAGALSRSVDVHVSRLRQKIEAEPRRPALIKTVRLGGYLFAAAVERL